MVVRLFVYSTGLLHCISSAGLAGLVCATHLHVNQSLDILPLNSKSGGFCQSVDVM